MHLYVTHRNHAAVRLYQKLGFKDVGESSDAVHDRLMKIGDLSSLTLPAKILRARAAKHAGDRRPFSASRKVPCDQAADAAADEKPRQLYRQPR